MDFSDLVETVKYTAKVKVILPANATLYVDGVAFTSATRTSTYETPQLEKGKVYYYNLEARFEGGREENLSKRVRVEAGKDVTVDFAQELNTHASLR